MCDHSFHPGHAKTAWPGGPGFWRNGRTGFSFLFDTISKNALKRPAFQKDPVKRDQSDHDHSHRHNDGDGDRMLLL